MTEILKIPPIESLQAEVLRDADESRYHQGIQKAVEQILAKNARFIFLAGPSCSGKTTTATALTENLKKKNKRVFTFSTDDFFFDGEFAPQNEDGTPNYDAFSHTDSDYICSVLSRLANGLDAVLPVFDFPSGKRQKKVTPVKAKDWDIFILEGIHALNPKILGAIPQSIPRFTIFLNTSRSICYEGAENNILSPQEVRFCRRVVRDYKHRFADAQRSYSLWRHVVEMEKEILTPFAPDADFFLATDFAYEIPVEKEQLIPLLKKVKNDSPFKEDANRLIEKLLPFPSLPKEIVPENSVLCEFIH